MSTTEFASAVAAVRALEGTLLSKSDIDRMIAARNVSEIAGILISAGKNVQGDSDDLLSSLESELDDVWNYIMEFATGSKSLAVLLYRNDFHNLKAAIKSFVTNTEPRRCFVRPTNLDLESLPEIISKKNYDRLPDYMSSAAAEAYDILTRTMDGQISDAVIDAAALKAMQNDSAKYGGDFLLKYSAVMTDCADIKTAYRCSKMAKSRQFLETAVCGGELDKEQLISAALRGTESFVSWLETTQYSEASEMLRESTAAFEKYCDDLVMNLAGDARMQAFGVEPLAAYFIAKEAELKNVRIILVCKKCGVSNDIITERMRMLYV